MGEAVLPTVCTMPAEVPRSTINGLPLEILAGLGAMSTLSSLRFVVLKSYSNSITGLCTDCLVCTTEHDFQSSRHTEREWIRPDFSNIRSKCLRQWTPATWVPGLRSRLQRGFHACTRGRQRTSSGRAEYGEWGGRQARHRNSGQQAAQKLKLRQLLPSGPKSIQPGRFIQCSCDTTCDGGCGWCTKSRWSCLRRPKHQSDSPGQSKEGSYCQHGRIPVSSTAHGVGKSASTLELFLTIHTTDRFAGHRSNGRARTF